MTDAESGRLEAVQVLRGVAALLVVAYHALLYLHSARVPGLERTLFRLGASGVDLFFMISGFIMVYTTRNAGGSRDALAFFAKRACRIVPPYTIITLIYVPIMLALGWFVGRSELQADPIHLIKSLLYIPTNFAGQAPLYGTPALHVGWTLNYEMYFYVIFALSILFGRLRLAAIFGLLFVSLILIPVLFGATPAAGAFIRYGLPGYLNLMSNPMLWEFAIGSVIGAIYLSPIRFPPAAAGLLCVCSSVVAMWYLVLEVSPHFGLTGWAAPYALVLFSFVLASKSISIKWPRSLIWVGNISFSLYLVHPMLIHPIMQALPDRVVPARLMDNIWFVAIVVLASVIVAAISHRFLEVGVSNWIRDKLLAALGRESRDGAQIASVPSA